MEESREEWSVFEWLEKAGMSQYAESFVDNGYDTPDLCAVLQNDDLTAIGVTNKKHRSVLFSNARELMNHLNTSNEAPDGPVNTPVEPIVVTLDTSSPTLPANTTMGSYTEPWQSYTEPWAASSPLHSNGVSMKLKKTGSGDKPPLPPPNKTKKKHPPPSPLPKDLPAFKRPEGGEAGLTKLQLQLKIREELRGEGLVLSEPPYVDEEGQMCAQPMSDLAERYSQKLKLQPLDIYDALHVIWNSENSFVTPLTPASADKTHPVILKGNSTENYDEPFDAAGSGGVPPDYVKQQSSPKGSKSHTLPSNSSTGNYDEPLDSVSKQQPQQQQHQLQVQETSPEETNKLRIETQSKTLPSPKLHAKAAAEEKDKKKSKNSSADGDSSPKHSALSKLFRRKEKGRSNSIQEFDMKQREEKKSGKKGAKISFPTRSKDALSLAKVQKKQNGSSPRHSKHVCMESSSETDESPQPSKKHSGNKFKKFVTPPTLRRDECPVFESSSSDDSTPETVRRLRAIRSRGLTGSDLEISFRDDGEAKKQWMVTSRSFDNLNDVNREIEETSEKKKEGRNIFSRIFKFRTLQSPARKKTANKQKSKKESNRSSLGYEAPSQLEVGESSLVNSLSMPEIAAVSSDKKKKKKKPFVSSSHTPPKHISDTEATPTVDSSPQHQVGTPDNDTANIPVPKPRVLSRTQSPNGGGIPFGGSAPVKPNYLSERGPTPEPRPRSKTPSSAGGSKNQSPHSSGSDIAMLDTTGSDSLSQSSQKSPGMAKKPAPPPKPAKIALFDEKSMEAYRSSTLPYGRGVSTSRGRASPPKPTKQFSVPNGNGSQSPGTLSQSLSSRTPQEMEARRIPPKPTRNFAAKTESQPEADTTPSKGTGKPDNGGGMGETPHTSGSSAAAVAVSTTPTPPQRPPPKPARSIRRKPQRDRVNREEQTRSKEVERPENESVTPPRSYSDSSADKVAAGGVVTMSTTPTGSGPPKPIRRVKTPKVIDSSSPQLKDEKERSSKTFDGRDQSSSVGGGNEASTKPAVRTLNVSTPSPTSSSPTTTNEGGNSFAEAAAFAHTTSATTAELVAKSTSPRFENGGTPSSSSSSGVASSKPRPMPKPRGLIGAAGGQSSVTVSGSTPRKPVPPSKPSRSSVRVATPEHHS